MNDYKLTNILIRIKKLLALANRNSSVEEAASAMAEAQRLMSKHQIDMATVEDGEPSSVTVEAIEQEHGQIVRWRAVLAMAVAEANFCCSVWVQNGRRGHGALTFFGAKANVTMAKALFELLVAQIERLTKEAISREVRKAAINARTFGDSFRLGAVLVIRQRLASLNEERDAAVAVSSETALTVIRRNDAAIESAIASLGKLQSTGESRAQVVPNAFKAGKAAGESVHIGQQLAGKASR